MGLPSSPAGGVVAAALLVLLLPSRALCDCPEPDIPPYSVIIRDIHNPYPVGAVLKLRCKLEFEHIPGTTRVITCLRNSTWSVIPTFCQHIKCPQPEVANGIETGATAATYVVYDNFKVKCHPGYSLVGPKHIVCGYDQNWHPSIPKCHLTGDLPSTTVPVTVPPKEDRTEAGYWKTFSIVIGALIAAFLLACLIFAAMTWTAP